MRHTLGSVPGSLSRIPRHPVPGEYAPTRAAARVAARVALLLGLALGLAACGGGGAGAPSSEPVANPPTPTPTPSTTTFGGNIVLGTPTATSVRANVYAPDQSGSVWIEWGPALGTLAARSATTALSAGVPVEIALDNLQPDTRYRYRLVYTTADGQRSATTEDARFTTARPPGSTFVFTIQGDSHPERARSEFDANLYVRTLTTAAADTPDFHVLMGDDFSVDTLDPATVSRTLVTARYSLQRPWLGLIGRSAPLFLVNGNHEQGARYLLDGTPDNVAVWAQTARNAHYPQPAPGPFYSGNAEVVPHIGLLRNYFAWTWGDALFVVIDPYWSSPVPVDAPFGGGSKRASGWDITHGQDQYQWLKETLEKSTARHKFVFAHHVMGTGRGGVELAGLWEWGGRNPNNTLAFATQRPGWAAPIHRLLADNRVSIFFQGHDHIWARQELDGVVYQTLPEPADPFYAFHNETAYLSGEKLPNSGYARVTVSPEAVKVEYVRTWLPADEGAGRLSGSVAASYTVAARTAAGAAGPAAASRVAPGAGRQR